MIICYALESLNKQASPVKVKTGRLVSGFGGKIIKAKYLRQIFAAKFNYCFIGGKVFAAFIQRQND